MYPPHDHPGAPFPELTGYFISPLYGMCDRGDAHQVGPGIIIDRVDRLLQYFNFPIRRCQTGKHPKSQGGFSEIIPV